MSEKRFVVSKRNLGVVFDRLRKFINDKHLTCRNGWDGKYNDFPQSYHAAKVTIHPHFKKKIRFFKDTTPDVLIHISLNPACTRAMCVYEGDIVTFYGSHEVIIQSCIYSTLNHRCAIHALSRTFFNRYQLDQLKLIEEAEKESVEEYEREIMKDFLDEMAKDFEREYYDEEWV